MSRLSILKGSAAAGLCFVGLGTVSALWANPLFVRMTPVGGWEIGLLVALAGLIGVYVAIRRPLCSTKSATAGGILGFLGVACPLCNKVLLILFGGELLLTYYEPLRIYVAAAGVAAAAWAVFWTWRATREPAGRSVSRVVGLDARESLSGSRRPPFATDQGPVD